MIQLFAHRGAPGLGFPENTLLSFQKALEYNIDMVEFDVHRCKSGELVVIHDYRLERTTNGSGYVKDHTLEELRLLDAGQGQKIPTLEETLDFIDRTYDVMTAIRILYDG